MVGVTVWNEYVHEREDDEVAAVYPDGIHAEVADALAAAGRDVRTATLDDPEHGLSEGVLDDTECSPGGVTPPTTRSRTRSSSACATGWGSSPCTPRTTPGRSND